MGNRRSIGKRSEQRHPLGRSVTPLARRVAALTALLVATGCGAKSDPLPPSDAPPPVRADVPDAVSEEPGGLPVAEQAAATTDPKPAADEPPPSIPPEQLEAEEAFAAMTAEGVSQEDLDAATERLLSIGAPAVPVLADALESDVPLHREMAATMLVLLGPDADAAAGQLVAALRDGSEFVRVNAATALAQMGQHHAEVLPVYEEFLSGDDPILRKTMASNLALLDAATAKPLVGPLIGLLNDEDRDIRLAAVEFLGRMGPEAAEAADALRAMATADDPELQEAVSAALGAITGQTE